MLASWQGGFEWMPAATASGWSRDREENGDVTHLAVPRRPHGPGQSAADADGDHPRRLVSAGFPLARVWIMRQGTGRVLFQESGAPSGRRPPAPAC